MTKSTTSRCNGVPHFFTYDLMHFDRSSRTVLGGNCASFWIIMSSNTSTTFNLLADGVESIVAGDQHARLLAFAQLLHLVDAVLDLAQVARILATFARLFALRLGAADDQKGDQEKQSKNFSRQEKSISVIINNPRHHQNAAYLDNSCCTLFAACCCLLLLLIAATAAAQERIREKAVFSWQSWWGGTHTHTPRVWLSK